jgi:NTP pyrophosphatase (non-canonical NTP hydrolase)
MSATELNQLSEALRAFAIERDWEQFHTPKNLSMAIMVEAAELAEHFLWTDSPSFEALSAAKRDEVELEIADVFLYLLRMSQILHVDLLAAARRKLEINEIKYPADRVRGSARKYTDYKGED